MVHRRRPITERSAQSRRRDVRSAHPSSRDALRSDPTTDRSFVALSPQGREAMRAKLQWLRDEFLPRLTARFADGDRDPRIDADYQRAAAELADISRLLEYAGSTEDLPSNPKVVELGDRVTISFADGSTEQLLIVHPLEAPFHAGISAESPLAKEVLGRRVGEMVEVVAPSGT